MEILKTRLSPQQWLQLDNDIRILLTQIFNIKRSEGSLIQDKTVISDGHTYQDLAVISVPAMQAYLLDTVETDFFKLFQRVLDVLKTENINLDDNRAKAIKKSLIISWVQDLEIIKKQAELNNLLKELRNEIINIFSIKGVLNTNTIQDVINKNFCNSCTSKGVRHTKNCTRYDPK